MPRKLIIALVSTFASCIPLLAQTQTQPQKQTARQALIEMFFAKSPDDFLKHLPEETRRTLIHKGDSPQASWLLRFAVLGQQLNSPGQHIETFDVGPTLLVVDNGKGSERFEVTVEHDSFTGDSDEIQLSVQYSKNGQPVALPVIPSFTFTLSQEKEIWRLTDVRAAADVPLTDPDYLKGLRHEQNEQNEMIVRMRMSMITAAETRYAAQHVGKGFTCSVQALFPGEQSDGSAAGNSLGLQPNNDAWNGYQISMSACDGSPALKYRVTAVPVDDEDDEMQAFCSDESGVIRSITADKSSSCFSDGQPLTKETSDNVVE
ncbi:MAG TPA: hypothetical protein VMX38_00720 [Verrucomicrobiae bacterium]|nr:hypothetical protein [Verrucomicrobiae bacterium]